MAYGDTGIGDKPLHQSGNFHDVLDPVMHKIDLTPARKLIDDGIADKFFVERPYLGADRVTVGRRCLDNRQVAGAHQGKLQGARNRGRGQGERVYIDFEFLELFFHRHAEFLFLVDDQKPQILEHHVLAQNPVRPDQDVHFSGFHVFQYLFLLLGRPETVQVFYPAREVLQTLLEGLVMLVGQDGSGNQNGHLLAVADGFESRPDGYFSLAEAHVPADQAVHGLARLHVPFHVVRRLELVGRVFVEER